MQDLNYDNETNNRLEGLNAKIKDVVPLHSSLSNFFISSFLFLTSQHIERNADTTDNVTKIPNSGTFTEEQKKKEQTKEGQKRSSPKKRCRT